MGKQFQTSVAAQPNDFVTQACEYIVMFPSGLGGFPPSLTSAKPPLSRKSSILLGSHLIHFGLINPTIQYLE